MLESLLQQLRQVLGEHSVLTGDAIAPRHFTDWTGQRL